MKKSKGLYLGERCPECACGCGEPLSIYPERNRGYFLADHFLPHWDLSEFGKSVRKRTLPKKPRDPHSCTLRYVTKRGYVMYRCPSYPAANKQGYILEHRLIAGRALGRPLGRVVDGRRGRR